MSDNTPSQTPSPKVSLLAHAVAHGEDPHAAVSRLQIPPDEAVDLLKSSDFQSLVQSYLPTPDEIRARFMQRAGSATKALEELVAGAEDESVRYRAAKDLLDRAGFTPVRRVATLSFKLPQTQRDHVESIIQELSDDEL
jgi:hypothetical protein